MHYIGIYSSCLLWILIVTSKNGIVNLVIFRARVIGLLWCIRGNHDVDVFTVVASIRICNLIQLQNALWLNYITVSWVQRWFGVAIIGLRICVFTYHLRVNLHVAVFTTSFCLPLLMWLYGSTCFCSTGCKIILRRRYFRVNLISLICWLMGNIWSVTCRWNRHVFETLRLLNHRPLAYNIVVLRIVIHCIPWLSLLRICCARMVHLVVDLMVGTISIVAASAISTKASFVTPIRVECWLIILLILV